MKKNLLELNMKLSSLTVFRELLSDPVVKAMRSMMNALETKELQAQVEAYCDFTAALYQETPDLGVYVNNMVLNDENFYKIGRAHV